MNNSSGEVIQFNGGSYKIHTGKRGGRFIKVKGTKKYVGSCNK